MQSAQKCELGVSALFLFPLKHNSEHCFIVLNKLYEIMERP